jgi:AcrR family transcriptional regulator
MSELAGGATPDGRERLINTAFAQFADRGFDGVSVRDISKSAGVSIGLINHHFGSKEGLREAVDRHFMSQFEEILAPVAGDLMARPEVWTDEWVSRHRAQWQVTVKYLRRALLEDSDWGGRIFARFYDINQKTVTRLDANGDLRPDLDRLWLPFLMTFLELGTTLLDPHITRVLGRSGFEDDLWRRRYRAYLQLLRDGAFRKRDVGGD